MKDRANVFLNHAVKKLNEANEELFKPEEDVVNYVVCKNSQFAIENYLKGYLLQKDVDITDYETIESLYEQCIKINKGFKKVNLSEFNCKAHKLDSKYCDELSKVSNCFKVAESLDTFLRKEKIIQ